MMLLMCAEKYRNAFSYFYLGVACYNLQLYDEAEKVLGIVNYLDPSHSETWAYIALVLLRKPSPPLNAAYQTINEAIKLGFNNEELLQEIAFAWIEVKCYKGAKEALEQACFADINPKFRQKLHDLLKEMAKFETTNKGMDQAQLKHQLTCMIKSFSSLNKYCTQYVTQSQPLGYYTMLLVGEFNLKPSDVIC